MKLLFAIPVLIFLAANPVFVRAASSCSTSYSNEDQIQRFAGLSDDDIRTKECNPALRDSNSGSNSRNVNCEVAETQLRAIAQQYNAAKASYCAEMGSIKPSCEAGAGQETCVAEAAARASAAKTKEEQLVAMTMGFSDKLKNLLIGSEQLMNGLAEAARYTALVNGNKAKMAKEFAESQAHLSSTGSINERPTRSQLVSQYPGPTTRPEIKNRNSGISGGASDASPSQKQNFEDTRPETSTVSRPSGISPGTGGNPVAGAGNSNNPAPSYNAGNAPATSTINPGNIAASSFDDYRRKLQEAVKEQKRVIANLKDFSQANEEKKAEHTASAVELGGMALQLLGTVKGMQTLKSEDSQSLGTEQAVPQKNVPTVMAAEGSSDTSSLAPSPEKEATPANSLAVAPDKAKAADASMTAATSDLNLSVSEKDSASGKQTEVLASFDGANLSPVKNTTSPKSLRDLLRKKIASEKETSSTSASEAPSVGESIHSMLTEQMKQEGSRTLASESPDNADILARGVKSEDVDSAMREMQGQLEELDKSRGILTSESESLFARVRRTNQRYQKSLARAKS